MPENQRFFKIKQKNGNFVTKGLGWLPDTHDHRDLALDVESKHIKIKELSKKISLLEKLPQQIDFRKDFIDIEIEDQGNLGSCTSNAVVGLIEYNIKKNDSTIENFSRLFLYKVTRNLLGWQGDTGAYIRTNMKALTLFGVPDESYWPYVISQFDKEPSAFIYSLAQNSQSLKYFRIDTPGKSSDDIFQDIKKVLQQNQPVTTGFSVYWNAVNNNGEISYPSKNDKLSGGHAIILVGYDDNKIIKHKIDSKIETKGAFVIRNSWGTEWGEQGYGYLSYEYFTNQDFLSPEYFTDPKSVADKTSDFWVLLLENFKPDVFE